LTAGISKKVLTLTAATWHRGPPPPRTSERLNHDFMRDIVPVAGINRFPNVREVNPSVPVKTVPEFIAYAKANPGKLNMASSGNGSTIHVSGELFKMMTGVNMIQSRRGAGVD
jgi:tripartite-type tricarboxylate transporter receptor subunit TctC